MEGREPPTTSPSGPRPAGARGRLRRGAGILAHVCGLTLCMKRYIEKSQAEEWALFHLNTKNHSASELLFNMSNFSKYSLSKDFEKLKTLLFIQPKQRNQENLREIQLCLKKNRSFHSLTNEVQLQLCQTAIYQEYEAESVVIKQGHAPLECYLILSGHLKVMSNNTSMNKNSNPEVLSLKKEICLLTNASWPASIFCKTDVKLLVISKEDFYCLLARRVQEQYQEVCSFLRNYLEQFISLKSTREKHLDQFLMESPIILFTAKRKDRLPGSVFLTLILQGHCLVIAQMNYEEISVHSSEIRTGSSTLRNVYTVLPPRETLDVTGRRLEKSTVSLKTSFSASRKTTLNKKEPELQVTSPATCFVEIRVLEQGGIFISEGAECIFIPQKLFLAEASAESKGTALELMCAYPTKEAIREHLVEEQMWNDYKARLTAPQLKRRSRPTSSAHFCFQI